MSTRTRPIAVAHGGQLQGELKIIVAIQGQPVIAGMIDSRNAVQRQPAADPSAGLIRVIRPDA